MTYVIDETLWTTSIIPLTISRKNLSRIKRRPFDWCLFYFYQKWVFYSIVYKNVNKSVYTHKDKSCKCKIIPFKLISVLLHWYSKKFENRLLLGNECFWIFNQKEKECQRKTNAAVEQSFSVIYQNVLKRVAMPSVLETNNIWKKFY